MSTLATFTNVGRSTVAQDICERELAIGWGTGIEAWDTMADSDLPNLIDRQSLYNEIGRRKVTTKGYCLPDANGSIIVPIGMLPNGDVDVAKYAPASEPTPYLYFRANYEFGDAPTAIIREIGLFQDTVYASGLPAGQQYFSKAQIAGQGKLMAMQIVRPPMHRSPSIRQMIEFVLPIQEVI